MPRFISIESLIDDLCLQSGDILKRNKGIYLSCANDLWNDLNDTTLRIAERVKIPVRQKFRVNKRTNSIEMPPFLRVCSVNVIDHCGNFHPVYQNDRLHDDLVDIPGTSDCACEYDCGYQLCNTIKGYEAVVSTKTDKLPNGDSISFTCVDRKCVDAQGFLYAETQYPIRKYLSGVWVDTVLHTENTKMCKLEVDDHGCVCDTEENVNAVCDSCATKVPCGGDIPVGGDANNPPAVGDKSWIYYCNTKMDWFSLQCGGFAVGFNKRKGCGENIYNISELGNRLIFPANFGWDEVMVRFYSDVDLKNIMVPYMAKRTVMAGLQFFACENNVEKQNEAAIFGKKYSRYKWGLFTDLNKYRIAEMAMIFTAPSYIPSYIRDYYGGELGYGDPYEVGIA